MTALGRPRTVAIIPARFASERLPGKPLAEIHGRPMIVHVMRRVAEATLVDRVIVATDDSRIAAVVEAHGGTALLTPANLRSGSDRVAYVARSLEDANIVVNVQGDEPLIPPDMIDEGIRPLLDDPSIDTATIVRRIHRVEEFGAPSVTKVVLDKAGNCLYFSRAPIPFGRDHSPEVLVRDNPVYAHVGLYVFRRQFLILFSEMEQSPLEKIEKLEQLRILENGRKIRAVITSLESPSVDTLGDLERVRELFQNQSTPRSTE